MPDPVITQGTTGQTARDLLALDYKQNAVPSSPITGDRWLRIDNATGAAIEPEAGAWWEYNGTYWLSEEIYSIRQNFINQTTNVSAFLPKPIKNQDLYFFQAELNWRIPNTHNSTNYWRVILRYMNGSITQTSLQTFNSFATGRDTTGFYADSVALTMHLDISALDVKSLTILSEAVNSPGALFGSAEFYYRLARA